MAKANADYGRLLRHTLADLEHFQTRMQRTGDELEKLLSKVPERARIWQLIVHHAANVVDVQTASDQASRYRALIDKANAGDGQQAAKDS